MRPGRLDEDAPLRQIVQKVLQAAMKDMLCATLQWAEPSVRHAGRAGRTGGFGPAGDVDVPCVEVEVTPIAAVAPQSEAGVSGSAAPDAPVALVERAVAAYAVEHAMSVRDARRFLAQRATLTHVAELLGLAAGEDGNPRVGAAAARQQIRAYFARHGLPTGPVPPVPGGRPV